jgi:hypothetical protein
MTRLCNLESYVECCQYSHLFDKNPKDLIPRSSHNAIPMAYKGFYQEYSCWPFLPMPSLVDQQPPSLEPRGQSLALLDQTETLGQDLRDGHSTGHLYIVREANSLVLRSLDAEYLYASVFHYWNSIWPHLSALTDKPIVIYDLSSFTPNQVIPITLETPQGCDYPIPIIDTRRVKDYQQLKLPAVSYEGIYDTICYSLATRISQDLNLLPQDEDNLSTYLKKINVYGLFQRFPERETLPLLLLVNDFYYTYSLSASHLADITLWHLPVEELKQVINGNPEFQYVCLGHYTTLPQVRQSLTECLGDSVLIPPTDLGNQYFQEAWKRKQTQDYFPLYGQHLDRITFSVKQAGNNLDINLPQKICYEGQQEIVVYGEYHNLSGIRKEEFPLDRRKVILPFQINGEDFSDQDQPQDYSIENQFFDNEAKLEIKICFRLKPGHPPKLEVVDSIKNRRLKSALIPRQAPVGVNCITVKDIKNRRQKIFNDVINNLDKLDNISSLLEDLHRELRPIGSWLTTYSNRPYLEKSRKNQLESLNDLLDKIREVINPPNDLEPLSIYVLPEDLPEKITALINIYSALDLAAKIERLFNLKGLSGETRNTVNKITRNALIVLGKSYGIGGKLSNKILFDNANKNSNDIDFDIYWQNLARLSSQKENQHYYFDLFFCISKKQGKELYKTPAYLWRYARILLWYLDFDKPHCLVDYRKHFKCILDHLLDLSQKNLQKDYREYFKDALITLIYLLSFREYDPEMVSEDSEEYQKARQLCDRLRLSGLDIRSKKAQIDMSLSDFLATLLDGTATQENASKMIEID